MTDRSDRAELRRLRDLAGAVQRGDLDAARAIAEGLGAGAQPRKATRRLVTLDAGVDALLLSAGNASAYVSALVTDSWTEWQEALGMLLAAGWQRAEITAAADALNGHALLGGAGMGWLWAELADAQQLNGTATKWHVEPSVWESRVAQVREDADLARALWTVVREWWRGNAALERALKRAATAP